MPRVCPLTLEEVARFVEDGFVRLDGVIAPELAAVGCSLLYDEIRQSQPDFDEHDSRTWKSPVVRLPGSGAEPFRAAAMNTRLASACNQLVGSGRWIQRTGLGTFPVRFPHAAQPDDTGWHIDGSFVGPDGSFWANLHSRGRLLLMLFLYTDIGPRDAPTLIRVGSHRAIPKLLKPYGDPGVFSGEVASQLSNLEEFPIAYATGKAGDVYLCHPFLVHAADRHQGVTPRVLAQPGLDPVDGQLCLDRSDGRYSPVEQAVLLGLL